MRMALEELEKKFHMDHSDLQRVTKEQLETLKLSKYIKDGKDLERLVKGVVEEGS